MKKNILVTGATSGIGRSIVQKLDGESNHLILVGRCPDKLSTLASQLTSSTTSLAVDLTDIESISALKQLLPSRIDGFVYAAGQESIEPIKSVCYKKFDYLMRLHVYAFVEILKMIEKAKVKTDEYSTNVVAISSIASDSGGVGQTIYAASKAALEAVVRVLAKELAAKRIRINTVKPGIVDTEMTRRWMRRIGIADKAQVDSMQLNGMASPEDVASLIFYLLSDESRHIVGTQIKIDGGGPSGKIF